MTTSQAATLAPKMAMDFALFGSGWPVSVEAGHGIVVEQSG
jgi:hypothetical protein